MPKGAAGARLGVFPVYDTSAFVSQLPENVGSKEKRWVMPPRAHELPHRPHLFKIGRQNTGENWSEKVCSEIGHALNLPCARYEFRCIRNRERSSLGDFLAGRGEATVA